VFGHPLHLECRRAAEVAFANIQLWQEPLKGQLTRNVWKCRTRLTTRCRWPSLNEMPLLPTTVSLPSGRSAISSSSAQLQITVSYQVLSDPVSPIIFWRMVLFVSHSLCPQYAISRQPTTTLPFVICSSPRMAFSKLVLPQPTGPIIIVSVLSMTSRVRSLRTLSSRGL